MFDKLPLFDWKEVKGLAWDAVINTGVDVALLRKGVWYIVPLADYEGMLAEAAQSVNTKRGE